ncbi:MAG: zf-HC2 domain-containing protein [Gemmatimonadota bacterium]
MKSLNCDHVRDVLPDLLSGRLSSVEGAAVRTHVQNCVECQVELDLATAVAAARLSIPAGLHARVVNATRTRRTAAWSGRMTLAAGIAVAVVGGSVLLAQFRTVPDVVDPIDVSVTEPIQHGAGWWSVEDAFVSGTASLRDLSEDELKKLLVELGT